MVRVSNRLGGQHIAPPAPNAVLWTWNCDVRRMSVITLFTVRHPTPSDKCRADGFAGGSRGFESFRRTACCRAAMSLFSDERPAGPAKDCSACGRLVRPQKTYRAPNRREHPGTAQARRVLK